MRIRGRLIGAGIVPLVIGAGVIVAVLSDGGNGQSAPRAGRSATTPSFLLLRRNGVSPAGLRRAHTLPSGTGVSTARGHGVLCVVLTNNDGNGNDGDCATKERVASGDEVLVVDRCTPASSASRIVMILVPSNVTAVRLDFSDGTRKRSTVV